MLQRHPGDRPAENPERMQLCMAQSLTKASCGGYRSGGSALPGAEGQLG